MNDFDHVVPSDLEYYERPSKLKKVLVVSLVSLAIFTAGFATLYFGVANNKEGQTSSSEPTLQLAQITGNNTLGESINNATPSPILSEAIPTATVSPSLKMTPTPTVSPTPTPQIKSKIISADKLLDGYRNSDDSGNNSASIKIGRNTSSTTRGFLSFDITDIPEDATIKNISLRVYQTKIVGDPYPGGEKIMLDHLVYGDNLDSADYNATTLVSDIVTLTANSVIEWKDANVSDAVKADISAGRTKSQFRLHFKTESQGGSVEGDYCIFESADNSESTGNAPQLVVEYY